MTIGRPRSAELDGVPSGAAARPDDARIARSVAELVFPVGVALLPFGLVLEGTLPASAVDATFILLTLFSVTLLATRTPLTLGLVLLMCVGATVAAWTERPNLFAIAVIPLVAYVMRNTDVQTLIRRFVRVSAALFMLVVGLYLVADFNRMNDVVMWRAYSGEFMSRASVGFNHPNRAMMVWSVIAIAILAFASPSKRGRWVAPILIVTVAMYSVTDSRTSAWLTFGFLMVAALWRRGLDEPVAPGIRHMAILAPAVFTVLSFTLAGLATTADINALLSGRPAIYASLMDDYSLLSVFGHKSIEERIVDNGYLQMFLSKGPILTLFYFAAVTSLIVKPARLSRRSVFILTVFLLSAVFETTLMSFAHLFLLFATLEVDRRREHQPESDRRQPR